MKYIFLHQGKICIFIEKKKIGSDLFPLALLTAVHVNRDGVLIGA